MPMRNPFTRRPGLAIPNEGSQQQTQQEDRNLGFERVDTVGSKASSILSTRSSKGHDNGEYKMSVVNDSGVYLPPSPIDEKGPWSRKYLSSRASTETGSSYGDIEHFSISRESFDSYRRSFDITARSPVISHDGFTRQSLDSARFVRLPRPSTHRSFERQPPTPEESFEDIRLDDQKQQPRKRGFFSKLTDSQDKDGSMQQGVSRFLIPSRKKTTQGAQDAAELGNIDGHVQNTPITAEAH